MRAVPQADDVIHLGRVSLLNRKLVTCERVGKILTGGCDLAGRGLTSVPQNCAASILGKAEKQEITTAETRQGLSPLLTF